MDCPRCRHDNPSRMKCCPKCGARLSLVCAQLERAEAELKGAR